MAADRSQESFLLQDTVGSAKMLGPIHTQRKGLRRFLLSNPGVIFATVSGLVCILAIFGFTLWLSRQLLECPPWAEDCHVKESVLRMSDNLGLVQGIVAAVYAVALAGPVYTACALGEAAVWPILNRQAKTLKELDSFLSATRGSIASLPLAYLATRSIEACVVILCITVATITPLVGSPVVGYTYTRLNMATDFTSNYQLGAVMRNKLIQANPPARLPGAVTDALSLYTSWSSQLSRESMPAFRDFIVRRDKLDARGQMSINAVKVEKNITCTGHKVELTDNDKVSVKAVTQMGNDNTTLLRIQPALTVWVDRVNYVSETRSVSTLIFAALNGTIEGGTSSEPTDAMKKKTHTGLQAVACDVDVNLINSSFQVGGGTGQFATISHLNMIEGPTHPDSKFGPLGDVAVWLGVVPVAMGISVHGAQPMFMDKLPLPRAYAAFTAPDSYHWKLETLHNFINVSSGALATSMHYIDETQRSNESPQNATLASRRAVKRLNPSRAYYLLIPPAIILVMIAALAFWNYWLHKRENIPIMRLADVSEVIKSSQTADIMEPAADDAKAPNEPSTLKKLSIKYGVTSGGAVGFGTSVSSF